MSYGYLKSITDIAADNLLILGTIKFFLFHIVNKANFNIV